jgi:hypothetical protein
VGGIKNMSREIVKITTFLILIFSGCSTYSFIYDFELVNVESSLFENGKERSYKLNKNEEAEILKIFYEDEVVKIIWIPQPKQIAFSLYNKSDFNLKIIWDEAAYIDENGVSRRVIHKGTKYIDRFNPQPPTIVAKNSYIIDLIYPADFIFYDEGWQEKPIFPYEFTGKREKAQMLAQNYEGKIFKILLPIEINGIKKEYLFAFKINNVKLKEERD